MLPQDVQTFVKERLAVVSDSDIDATTLTEGRSGDDVYRIKVISRRERLTGSYIVKVCSMAKSEEEKESYKANLLYQSAPSFSSHLVKVEAEKTVGSRNVIIYHQANNSIINMEPFSELNGELLAKYMKQVSFDILSLMNEDEQIGGTVEDFFRCLLSKQLRIDGRFKARIETLIENPETACLALNGAIYPNPLYFINNISKWGACLSDQIFLKGMVHGDLHGYNLIASEDTYSLIDYDSVMEDAYLFFDHAYFEFSIFYDNSKNNDLKKWNSMLDNLVKPSFLKSVEPCEYYKEYMARNAVCEGIRNWMNEKKLEKMKDDIELQFLMARIVAGINFLCKRSCADTGKQIKVLFYIAYCCKQLLNKIGYQFDENDVSTLCASSEYANTEELWEEFVKYTNYVPILITDDKYSIEEYQQLKNLCGIDWQMVIDIGLEQVELRVYKSFLDNYKSKSVKKINVMAGEKAEVFSHTLNVLTIRKAVESSYSKLWRTYGKAVIDALKKLFSANPQVPVVLVFDCSKDSLIFRNQLINSLCDLKLPGATRIVSLRAEFSKEMKDEIKELEDLRRWHFIECAGINLTHVAQTCGVYLNKADSGEYSANLPAINGICTFSEKDLNYFESCLELVYSGCERINKNELIYTGLDMSGMGDGLGETFYKGNEATWNDIANHRDLDLIEAKRYKESCEKLENLLEDKSPRVKTIVLLHGAGAGGTTLSKRILWDFREQVPCVRLKKYSPQVASMLLEIYQRTGKCIFLAVESGSTVISEDELYKLKQEVDAENGRLVILLIKRLDSNSHDERREERRVIFETLGDTMPISIARNFRDIFSMYAMKKENGGERKRLIETITGNDGYKEQRSPFFYGFYTFQEEYQMIGNLRRTVSDCNSNERILLNNLALVTYFSQNVCVTFSELRWFLSQQSIENIDNVYALLEKIPSALLKLTTIRDKGLRLCHKVIAEKILLLLYFPEEINSKFEDVVFKATKKFIESLGEMYDNDSEYVNNILKELIIDRAYIDSEQRKTKFSALVEYIPHWTDKKALFELLIEKFPNNPHYYNHLARLLATGDKNNGISPKYEEAEKKAEMAIEIATTAKSTHETTLGCIYGQWILNDIDVEWKNKKRGRLSSKYSELINNINVHYELAKTQFSKAREDIDVCDSFSYFPQINMECEIIKHLIIFDSDRNLNRLLEEEPIFSEWYDEHFSVAMELYLRMKEQLGDEERLLGDAKNKLNEIARDSDQEINKRFTALLDSDAPIDRRRRRSLVYTVFSINGCNWNKIKRDMLHLAERCFRKNFLGRDIEHGSSDVETWFEMYRRTEYFQASYAQSLIADYMEDGYRKEYLLFLMTFIMRKNGIASASEESIIHRISDANRFARLSGLNTAREHDVYVGKKDDGCPIVPISVVARDEKGEPKDLEVFTGVVTEVEQTHGKILLDKLNLEVTFVPKPLSIGEDPSRIFSREDINCHVKLNIMFAYSGLRAWKVVKI